MTVMEREMLPILIILEYSSYDENGRRVRQQLLVPVRTNRYDKKLEKKNKKNY